MFQKKGVVWGFCLSVIFLLHLSLFSCSPRHRAIMPNVGIQPDPSITYGTLANGFQYVIKKNPLPADRVYIHLDVFAGSMHETDEQQGVAHYLEHLLFNGSEHFEPGELIDYFHSIGMDFGADANAHTTFYNTVYDLALPTATKDQLDRAFLIIQDYAKGALLLESEVERERGIILAEKRERDSVSARTFKKTMAFELPGSLIPKRWPIGIESVINQVGRKELKDFYDTWYRPDNMALIVVGDLDVGLTRNLIFDRFSRLAARDLPMETRKQAIGSRELEKAVQWLPHKGNKAFYHFEPEASVTEIAIQTIDYEPFKAQTAAMLKQQTLLRIANGMIQNRISRQINDQSVDFIHASAYAGKYLRHIKAAGIAADCQPENWEKSLIQIEQILRQAFTFGFTQKELDRVKADIISSLEQTVEQAKSRKSDQIARRLLSRMNNHYLMISDDQKLDLLKPFIQKITREQALHALKESWDRAHRLVTITGNVKIDSKDPAQLILDTFDKSRLMPVEPYLDFKSKSFPYLQPSKTSAQLKPIQGEKDLGIERYTLGQNVIVNLKKTDYKPKEFSIKVIFGQGKRSMPRDKPGLYYLAENVINDSGLGQMGMDQLEEALAGKKIQGRLSIHQNYMAISGSGNPDQAETVFQLIFHYLSDPGFTQPSLDRAKVVYRQEYESMSRTPDGLMQIKGNRFLATNDSRFGLPDPQQMESYSLVDVKQWLLPAFKKAPIEISLVGDFNKEKVLSLISAYFGSLQNRSNFPVKPLDTGKIVFPKGQTLNLEVDTKIDSAQVRVAFLTDDFWDIAQTRQLSVLSRVFSERLRTVIREELGESYSPHVFNQSSTTYADYGVFQAVIKVKPGREEHVLAAVNGIVESIRAQGISDQETQHAVKPVLTYLKTLRKTNGYWLNSVMSNASTYPVKFEWARNLIKGYQSIQREELTALARKYLVPNDQAVLIIAPK